MKKEPFDIFKGKKELNVLRDSLREIKNNVETHIEYLQLIARLTKTKYDALLKEGFTEEQAIRLCKTLF